VSAMSTMSSPLAAEPARRGPGLPRKVVSVLMIVVGLVFIALTLASNLFKVGPSFESLIDDFRPLLAQQSIDTARQDLAGLTAVSQEFQTKLAPAMSQQLGMTQEQFAGMVTEQFPAVDAGMKAIPQAVPAFGGLLDTLQVQRPLFESADAIPTTNLPATTVPWSLLAAGILSILVGLMVWFTRRAGAVLALLLGAALVVAPLLLSLPGKAADADQLNKNLTPVYTQTLVDQSTQTLSTIGAMGEQMQTSMLPALATQLKMQPDQLQTFLAQNFPTTASALTSFPTTMKRFQGLVSTFDANLDNFEVLKPVEFVPIIRALIAGGVALLLLGGAALFATAAEQRRV